MKLKNLGELGQYHGYWWLGSLQILVIYNDTDYLDGNVLVPLGMNLNHMQCLSIEERLKMQICFHVF